MYGDRIVIRLSVSSAVQKWHAVDAEKFVLLGSICVLRIVIKSLGP
jgi:hypothetical protein